MIDWFDLLAVQKDPQKYSPKSLQMLTVAMKLKDVCSLEEKL